MLNFLHSQERNYHKLCVWIFPFQQVAHIFLRIATDNLIVFFRKEVVDQRMQTDAPTRHRFQTQQRVVNASQTTGSDEHQRYCFCAT